MFKKSKDTMAKSTNHDPNALTSIAAGTRLEGDLIAEGPIRIEGALSGSIKTQGKLIVGNSGTVEGEVVCKSADVSGSIKGKLTTAELLNVQATGKVQGEVIYGKLGVEPGALLAGNFQIAGVVKDISHGDQPQREFAPTKEKTA